MDKLKKVFSPGSSKDDEVMYGEHGASTNPQGERYSEQSHGATQVSASTAPTSSTSAQSPEDASQWRDATLAGIDAAGGTGGTGASASEPSEGIQRQQSGDDVSDSTYTARSYQLSSGSQSEPQGPDRTVEPTDTRHAGKPRSSEYIRDGSLAGAGTIIGAGAVGEAALAAQEDKPKDEEVANATYTDRAYSVGGSSTENAQDGVVPTDAGYQDTIDPSKIDSSSRFGPHVPGEFPTESGEDPHVPGAFPVTPDEEADRDIGSGSAVTTGLGEGGVVGPEVAESSDVVPPATEDESHFGRNAAIVGGATAATGAAGYGIYEATNDEKATEDATQDRNVPQTTTTESTTTKLDPEHYYGRDAAVVSGGTAATGTAGYGIYEATKGDKTTEEAPQVRSVPEQTTTEPTEPEREPHYGRDAVVAGGATAATGAAGYGIYEATKEDEARNQIHNDHRPDESGIQQDTPTKTEKVRRKLSKKSSTKRSPDKTTTTRTTTTEPFKQEEQPDETHYGRDAAIVGGSGVAAGAAGYGVYEATKDDSNDTGPASKTIGPHESNIANVLDPRVKPEPEKMKENEPITTGPYKSDMANVADPRVQSDPAKAQEAHRNENSYGRDAAVAGGAGAAGAGTYYASKDSEPSTPTSPSRDSYESPNNKTSVDSRGHHHLHKKSVEQQGEKKPGLVSRILHPNRTKKENEEREAARRSMEQPDYQQASPIGKTDYQQPSHMGTDGEIGDSNRVSGTQDFATGAGEARW